MGRLTAIVLGAAAGGGFPQWNCRCPVCRLAWDGDPRVTARTQAGLAVSADGHDWILINASPDLRAQIEATAVLHPHNGLRGSPIGAVVLTGAEVDQIAGLLALRERSKFSLYATAENSCRDREQPYLWRAGVRCGGATSGRALATLPVAGWSGCRTVRGPRQGRAVLGK